MTYFSKKTATAVAVLLLAAAPVVAQSPVQEDAFGIVLPAGFSEFAKQTQTAESPEGKVETTNWISRATETGEAVVVTVSKMPGHILDPEKLMDATRDSLLSSLKATLESEQDLEAENPTTQLVFRSESATPAFLQSQLVVDDDRLFQVLYVGRSPEQREAPGIRNLFSSFRVVEQEQPVTTTEVTEKRPE